MAFDLITEPATESLLIEVLLRSATTGQPLTGLAVGDVTVEYQRDGAAAAVDLSNPAVLTDLGTWETDAWKETAIAGLYQYGVPNAAVAAGAAGVTLVFAGTGAIAAKYRILLEDLAQTGADGDTLEDLSDEIAAVAAKADLIGTSGATLPSAVAASGYVTIYGGDDYADADGRALTWTITGATGALLDGAAIVLRAMTAANYKAAGDDAALEAAGSVSVDAGTATVTVELAAADTAGLEPAGAAAKAIYVYQLIATLAGGGVVTAAKGEMIVWKGIDAT